jgi:CRISP-associated protein Cas1
MLHNTAQKPRLLDPEPLPAPQPAPSGSRRDGFPSTRHTPPDLAAVTRELAEGGSLAAIWRRYAATAPAPLRYTAFRMRVAKARQPQPQPGETAPEKPNRSLPARLAAYSMPSWKVVDEKVRAGATVRAVWREYADTTHAPIKYGTFANGYARWLRQQKPAPEIAPGIPSYTPAENAAAEAYWADRADPSSTVLVLAGFGCSLKVEHGSLVAFDTGTTRRIEPINHRISVIVFGPFGGLVSTRAIEWCADRGISIISLDYHGRMVSVTATLTANNILLRRAQVRADPVAVGRAILLQKLASTRRAGKQSEFVYGRAVAEISAARSIDQLLTWEAQAGVDYWQRWQFPLRYHPRGWPPSWCEFNNRSGRLGGSPQHATHPANAMLNYAYSIVASMCVRSLYAAGFDPALGFLHADSDGRYSLAYDLLELLRADIDAAILTWVAAHRWRRADFPVTRSAIVRVHPNLARVVMQRTVAAVPAGMVDKATAWLADTVKSTADATAH